MLINRIFLILFFELRFSQILWTRGIGYNFYCHSLKSFPTMREDRGSESPPTVEKLGIEILHTNEPNTIINTDDNAKIFTYPNRISP